MLIYIVLDFDAIEDDVQNVLPLDAFTLAPPVDVAADVGHFEAFEGVMDDVGRHVDVGDGEEALVDAVVEDVAQDFRLSEVEFLAGLLHAPDVAKEGSAECAIAKDDGLDGVETHIDVCDQLSIGWQSARGHLEEGVDELIELGLDNGVKDVVFAFEVGVKCAAALLRGLGNIVHRGVLEAHAGKELTGYVNQYFTRFGDRNRHGHCTLSIDLCAKVDKKAVTDHQLRTRRGQRTAPTGHCFSAKAQHSECEAQAKHTSGHS